MIYKLLGIGPEDALTGTTVLHTAALMAGAQMIRVHDVKEAREVVRVVGELGELGEFSDRDFSGRSGKVSPFYHISFAFPT